MSGMKFQAIIVDARNVSEAVKERARRARGFWILGHKGGAYVDRE
jgi:hypothetical protein